MLGKIKSYSKSKGYGFLNAIGPDKTNVTGDIFFNIREVSLPDKEPPQPGDVVEFSLGKDRVGRKCATRVRLPGAAVEPVRQGGVYLREDMRAGAHRRDAEEVFRRR